MILREFANPTPEEVMGSFHAAQFRALSHQQAMRDDEVRSVFQPIVSELIPVVAGFFPAGTAFDVEYLPPAFIAAGDAWGDTSHCFALRLKHPGVWPRFLPRIFRRRTILVVAIDDPAKSPNNWLNLAISHSVDWFSASRMMPRVLMSLSHHLDVPADRMRVQIGFGGNFALLNYSMKGLALKY